MRLFPKKLLAVLLAAALAAAWFPAPAPRAQAFTDTGGEPAAIRAAIDYVTDRGWMEGYGDGAFRPSEHVTRIDAARGLVCVFGHGSEEPVPGIHFPDLPPSDPRYRWANLAFYHGLMDITPEHCFLPDEPVIYERLTLGVTHGLGLDAVAANICNIVPGTPYYGGSMVVFHDLHLKYYDRDYPFSVRVWPGGPYPRGNLAFTLQRLANLERWRTDYLRNSFTAARCRPPAANDLQQTALEYGFERLGQAYLYGGESEAEGGFDCSGFIYNTLCMRMGYRMMRVADDQARDDRYLYVCREALKPGDAIFWYDEEGGGSTGHIGHAGMYVGDGLFIHSTGSNAGVSLDCLDTNSYWSSHFAWGRRVAGGPYYNRFDEFLLLSNPSEYDADVHVEYLRPTEPPLTRDYRVAPNSRATIGVDSLLPYDEVSLRVTSTGGIVAERAMYFDYGGKRPGGSASIGAPEPAASWFLAEGCTHPGFDTWLLLANPDGRETWARVSYLREAQEPIEQEYYLAPHSRASVHVNQVPGIGGTGVSMRADSVNGVPIVAERAMYFDYHGLKGGSGGAGITQASQEWFLAEGYTGAGFDTWLLLANPGGSEAAVDVDFLLEGGEKVPLKVKVPARSRFTIDVNREVPPGNVSARVASDRPIVAERAMYFDYHGKQGGHASAGSTSCGCEWHFAEGYTDKDFDTWLLLANPGAEDAAVRCRFMREDGGVVELQSLVVPAQSRFTIHVDRIEGMEAAAFATLVTSDRPIAAERAMYFNYNGVWDGGSDSRGVASPRQEWYFAEGYTGG